MVLHPDFVGFGIGMKVIDILSEHMKQKGYVVMAKFSSIPLLKSRERNKKWKLVDVSNNTQKAQRSPSGSMHRTTGMRVATRTFSFKYVGASQ